MARLPNAFKPLVGDDLKYYRKIQKVDYLSHENKVQISWKNHYTDCEFQKATYDHTFVAVPFTVVRKWKLPGTFTIPEALSLSSKANSRRILPNPEPRNLPAHLPIRLQGPSPTPPSPTQ